MMFKIINGKLGIKEDIFFKFNMAATRGHKQKLFKQRAIKIVRSQSFSCCVINEWNLLSLEVAETADDESIWTNFGNFSYMKHLFNH